MRQKTKISMRIAAFLAAALMAVCIFPAAAYAEAGEQEEWVYEHDPMDNPKAAEDIIVNPDAVYGYSPNPESSRLGVYASYDWSDKELVEKSRQDRIAYHESMSELYRMIEDMLGEAKNVEEIARAVSQRRNELRLESYKDDPEGLEKAKQSNLDTYGNEFGPTADSLYEKYGSWQTVMEKALSANPGMDACLGLYDEYYDTYDLVEKASENAAGTDTVHTVVRGEYLWKIAEQYYGDGSRYPELYEKNKELLAAWNAGTGNPSFTIYPGQKLVL